MQSEFNIVIPDEAKTKIQAIAEKQGVSTDEIVRKLIHSFVDKTHKAVRFLGTKKGPKK